MKKILGLAALAVAVTVSASAATIEVQCGSFADSLGNTADSTIGVIPSYPSATIVCAAPSATLVSGDTFSSLQLVFQQAFTTGSTGGPNTIVGTYTVTGAGLGSLDGSETLTTSAATGDSGQTTTDPSSPGFEIQPDHIIEGGSSSINNSVDVVVSESLSAGQIQSATGNVYELITYSTAAPEPMTFSLMGVGLLGMGLVGRRLRKQKQ
jgi:hypothetical protein